jgi:suppressor of cytokine signaling 2
MLSLSITASSATSLNGGHVVVNTSPAIGHPPTTATATATAFSVTATLPPLPAWQMPWSQPPPPPTPTTTWGMMPAPAVSWTAPPGSWLTATSQPLQPPPAWTAPPPPAVPLNLSLGLRQPKAGVQPQPPACLSKGVQYLLTGGGILQDNDQPLGGQDQDQLQDQVQDQVRDPTPVLLQPRGKLGLLSCRVGPEQSHSSPLSFVLASRGVAPVLARPEGTPEMDLRLLQSTTAALKTSGWYYEGFSWQESAATLRHAAPGTFLVRDSSDPRFLFSLSVQTDRGPTSVRLLYISGGFRLDAEPRLAPAMPLFPCVLELVQHYVATGGKRTPAPAPAPAPGRGREQVWVDARGQMYSHILLTVPHRHTVPGLQHLARLAVNRQMRKAQPLPGSAPSRDQIEKLELPTSLRRYLEDYPYTL